MAKQVTKPKPDEALEMIRAYLEEHGPHKDTAPGLAAKIGIPVEVLGRAAQRTRKGDFAKQHGWWIPPTGRGKDTVWQVKRVRRRQTAAAA